jgi:hypothetical protein
MRRRSRDREASHDNDARDNEYSQPLEHSEPRLKGTHARSAVHCPSDGVVLRRANSYDVSMRRNSRNSRANKILINTAATMTIAAMI